jgi:hypothetical protein
MDDKDELLSLDGITCIDSAEGMARRVLNDLEKSGLPKKELARVYKFGLRYGGSDYPNLIRLGNLMKEITSLARSIKV